MSKNSTNTNTPSSECMRSFNTQLHNFTIFFALLNLPNRMVVSEMAQNEITYEYVHLKEPKSSIRLLTVIADDFDAPLRSSLQEITFQDTPNYIALSYVWGSPGRKENLQIDNRVMRVQPNVINALRRLRAIKGTFTIWIDAICINQSNLDERSTQVSIMRIIYESASCVFVYLGEDDESQQLQSLLDSLINFIPVLQNNQSSKLDWDQLNKDGQSEVTSSQWQRFVRFLENPWFRRAWVFQEILVAKKSTFIQGDCVIDHAHLFALLHGLVSVHRFEAYIDQTPRMHLSPVVKAAQRCTSILSAQGPIVTNFLPNAWRRQPLIHLLRDNINSKATDPRDRIFAFLGVSDEADEPDLQPDYKEDVNDTYRRVGKYMAEKGFTPLLLECTTRSNAPNWPSWIPRWNEPCSHTFVIEKRSLYDMQDGMRMSAFFSAASNSVQMFHCQADYTLLAQGIIVDEIGLLGTNRIHLISLESLENAVNCLPEVLYSLLEAISMLSSRPQSMAGETMSAALSRVIVCDQRYAKVQKAPKEYQKGLGGLLDIAKANLDRRHHLVADIMLHMMPELISHNDDEGSQSFKWATEFLPASFYCYSRLIRFATGKGYIGQVVPDVKVGDKIALLQGCDVPLILRPTGNSAYTYISTCYLHGIMYGEAWNEEDIQAIKIV